MKSHQDTCVRKRDPLFDVVKAFLMLWIVWGHCCVSGVVARSLWLEPFMKNAKIGVDMPLFFALSGFLSQKTLKNGSWKKILSHVIHFLWPAASFGLIFAFLGGAECPTDICSVLHFAGKQALYGHWFLRCLVAIYIVSAVVIRLFRTNSQRMFAFLAAWLFFLLLNDNSPDSYSCTVFGGWQAVHMLPYFVFGLMVLPRQKPYLSKKVSVCCFLAFFTIVIFEGNSSANGMNYWAVTTNWKEVLTTSGGILFVARTLTGCLGSVSILWVWKELLDRFPRLAALSIFGTTTLGVYVLHEWPLYRIGSIGSQSLPLPAWSGWPLALAWFLVCHVIILGIRNVGLLKVFFFGNERFLIHILEKCDSWLKSLPGFTARR